MNSSDEDAYRDYKLALEADLRQNVKPVIFALSMLAEDYKVNSAAIAKAIEDYTRRIPSDMKILGLYLMDSIMKNHKYTTNYNEIFETKILGLFTHVFESVDEQNRKSLYKLRQTWNEVFSNRILYEIDVKIKRIDPAWPITASTASAPPLNNQTNLPASQSQPATSGNSQINNPMTTQVSKISINQESKTSTKLQPGQKSLLINAKSELSSKKSIVKTEQNKLKSDGAEAQIRDPRIRDPRKNKSSNNLTAPDKVTAIEHNIFETKTTSQASSPKTKMKNNNTSGNMNGLKRTSPNNLNPNEIKKPKLAPNQTSPTSIIAKLTKSATNSLVKSSKIDKTIETTSKSVLKINSNIKSVKTNVKSPGMKSTGIPQELETKNESVVNITLPKTQLNRIKSIKQKPESESINKTGVKSASNGTTKQASNLKSVRTDDKNSNVKNNNNDNNNGNKNTSRKLPSILDIEVKSNPVIQSATKSTIPLKSKSNLIKTKESETVVAKKSDKVTDEQISLTFNDVDERITDVDERTIEGKIEIDKSNATTSDKQVPDFSTSKLNELSNLISETKSGDKGSATDFLAKLLQATKPTQTQENSELEKSFEELGNENQSIDKLLQNSKNSLNELQRQLTISKQNDEQTADKKTSTNTQQLLEMIGSILEMTQQKLKADQQAQPQDTKLNPQTQTNDFRIPQKISLETLMASTPTPQLGLLNEPQNNNTSSNNTNNNNIRHHQSPQHMNDFNDVTYDLPPIKPRDKTENQNDSLLIIDGRSYTIQPEMVRLIKVYYHDHELFCDTRTKDVFIDKKRVYRMGDPTKEIVLNGRKVRLMYMGKRIELWIDGISFHFRADSPPKSISITSSQSNQIKRYYVTIDSRTMDMYFNNFKVCQIKPSINPQGPQNQSNTLMCKLAPDDYELHEISFVCPPKRIQIDGVPRTMRYDLAVPCIEMSDNKFYVIRFSGQPREIYIDEIPYVVPFDKTIRIKLNGRAHELAWGGPGFEVIIDGRPYELQFNKPPREIIIGTRPHFIYICGEAPDVKICGQLPYEFQQPLHDKAIPEKIEKKLPSLMNFDLMPPNLATKSGPSTKLLGSDSQKAGSVDLTDLLKKLKDQGLINLNQDSKSVADKKIQLPTSLTDIISGGKKNVPDETPVKQLEKIPDLTSFDTDLLKQKYSGAIQSLYSGIQCATCGNRFNQNDTNSTTVSGSRYSKHLDWHFRQNKKEKDEMNKAHSRAWYYILTEWIQYEELSEDAMLNQESEQIMQPPVSAGLTLPPESDAKQNPSNNDDGLTNENNLLDDLSICMANGRGLTSQTSVNSYTAGSTCPATDDIDDKCCICKDFFEIFFYQEKEEWHFKDAVRVESKVYHPICYEDAREDLNSINNTPVNKTMTVFNNSMNGSLIESGEAQSETSSITIKNEPGNESQITESTNVNDSIQSELMSSQENANTTVEMNSILSENEESTSKPRLVSSFYDENLKDEPKTP